MGFLLTLFYLVYMYASLAIWAPWLIQVPIEAIAGVAAVFASVPRFLNYSSIRLTPQIVTFTAFTLLASASMLLQGWFGGIPKVLLEFMPALVLLFLIWLHGDSSLKRRILALAMGGLLVVLVGIGSWEYYHHPDDSVFVYQQGRDDEQNPGDVKGAGVGDTPIINRLRAGGMIGDPNDLAQMLLVTLALLGCWWGRGILPNILFVVFPGAVLLYGVYLTRSRGAVLTLGLMLLVAARRRLHWFGGALLGTTLVGILLFAGRFTAGREVSLQGGVDRLALWSEGLQIVKHSPLWGSGYRTFSDSVGKTAHNSMLLVGAELGVLGLTLWLSAFVVSFIQLKRIIDPPDGSPPDAELRTHARALELALTAYLGTCWFLSRVYTPLPFFLVGLVAALATEQVRLRPGLTLLPPITYWLPLSFILGVSAIGIIYVMIRLGSV